MAKSLALALAFTACASASVSFGAYSLTQAPPAAAGAGWRLATAADIQAHRAAFVAQYNANGGVPTLGTFKSGNCCIALAA